MNRGNQRHEESKNMAWEYEGEEVSEDINARERYYEAFEQSYQEEEN